MGFTSWQNKKKKVKVNKKLISNYAFSSYSFLFCNLKLERVWSKEYEGWNEDDDEEEEEEKNWFIITIYLLYSLQLKYYPETRFY